MSQNLPYFMNDKQKLLKNKEADKYYTLFTSICEQIFNHEVSFEPNWRIQPEQENKPDEFNVWSKDFFYQNKTTGRIFTNELLEEINVLILRFSHEPNFRRQIKLLGFCVDPAEGFISFTFEVQK